MISWTVGSQTVTGRAAIAAYHSYSIGHWLILFCIVLHAVCWTWEEHVHGLGGTGRTDIGSVEECKQECLRIRTCVAVDWDPTNSKGKKCWILTDLVDLPTGGDVAFDHYVLDPACRC